MSIVTTQPEMLTPTPSKSDAWLLASGSNDYPSDGAGGTRLVDRRHGTSGDSPMDILTRLPALVVLERIPVPSLAMARDGIILFANSAFAEMVGYQRDTLVGLVFPAVFRVPATLFALSGVDVLTNLVVELDHCEGWTVRARMSESALMRRDDPVVLVTFQDLTERLWTDERTIAPLVCST